VHKVKASDRVVVGVRAPHAADRVGPTFKLQLADMSKPMTLMAAFKGVDRALIVTPGDEQRAKLTIRACDAAKKANVKFLVRSCACPYGCGRLSVMQVVVSVATAGAEGTIFGRQFTEIENHVRGLGLPWCIVQLPFFMENNLGHVASIKSQGKVFTAMNPDAKMVSISVSDVGDALSTILTDPFPHVGKTYRLTCKPFTMNELAAGLTHAVGKPVEAAVIPYEGSRAAMLAQKMPEWQVVGVLELCKLVDAGHPALSTPSDDFSKIVGREAVSIEQWADQNADLFK
jgi:uncharacterized protein YbjT (DUF2867 family)